MMNTTDHVGFVPNPNCGRGTISLLLQCFSTIFLCVYTSLHLDVPRRPLTTWESIYRKSCAVAFCVIAPEIFTLLAFVQWLQAKQLKNELKSKMGSSISMKQVYFLLADGIHVKIDDGNRELLLTDLMGRFSHFDLSTVEENELGREFWERLMAKIPSNGELDDKSKSSPLAKVVTCFQAGKTLVLILGRSANRFDVSLLEVATVAYIAVTLLSYYFCFSKSYDIQLHETITVESDIPEKRYNGISYADLLSSGSERLWNDFLPSVTYDQSDSKPANGLAMNKWVAVVILGSVFATIHCAAWSYAFPSLAEAYLWRVSCVIITAVPWFLSIAIAIPTEYWNRTNWIFSLSYYTTMVLYVTARVILIVEIFISLRSAPRGIYEQPNWAPYLGHDGA